MIIGSSTPLTYIPVGDAGRSCREGQGEGIVMKSFSRLFKEPLIYSSFRRMPESMLLKSLDPGIRRDDGKIINQRFLKVYDSWNHEIRDDINSVSERIHGYLIEAPSPGGRGGKI